MFLVFAFAAMAVPSPSDVHAVEELRVLEPLVSYDRKGRRFVEFAPTVQTRAVTCVGAAKNEADCTYEARVRDFFASDFGPWETRRERLIWIKNCWVRLPSKL
jgi:hypothetical protein